MTFKGYLPLDIKLGGDAMKYYYLVILVLVVATGYILSKKNNRPTLSKFCGYSLKQ
mgnify:CR=1 FL=1